MAREHAKSIAVVTLSLGFALGGFPTPARSQSVIDVVKALERFVVRVAVQDRGTRSGLVVVPQGSDVLIVTVLASGEDGAGITVTDSVGRSHAASLVSKDRGSGLTTLTVKNWPGPRVVDVDTRPLQAGEPVVVLGYGQGRGELSYLLLHATGPRQLDQHLPSGFQGGAVVSLTHQRVLGVLASVQGNVIPGISVLTAVRPSAVRPPGPQAPTNPTPVVAPPPVPSPGQVVTISSFPAGAAISVDGASMGQAPVRIPASRIGQEPRRIAASAPGRLSVSRTVAIASDTAVDLVLPPAPSIEPPTLKGRELLARLQAAFSAGDTSNAVSAIRELFTETPSLTEVRIYQATALWLHGSRDEALAAVRAHINIHGETSRSVDAYVLLGILLEEGQQYQGALTGYKLAVKVHPAYAREFAQRVAATDAMIQAAARQVAKDPTDFLSRIRLGLLYEAKGRFREGMGEFKAVLFTPGGAAQPAAGIASPVSPTLTVRTFPARASVFAGDRLRGQSPVTVPQPFADSLPLRVVMPGYAEMRRTITVRRRTDVLFVLLPTLEGYGRTKFVKDKMHDGLQGFATGDWAAGTRAFVEALESDYILIRLHLYIGAGYYMQGRISESLEALRRYINIRNNDTTAMLAYVLMGVIFEEQSRFGEALTAYKLALKLHPAVAAVITLPPVTADNEIAAMQNSAQGADDPRLLYRLGAAFEAKGRLQEGMSAMRRALFSLGTI